MRASFAWNVHNGGKDRESKQPVHYWIVDAHKLLHAAADLLKMSTMNNTCTNY